MTSNNLCNSCSNYGCEFQSGIVRTKCAFYMPPHIEPDNCGNYVVMQPVRLQEPKTEQFAKWVATEIFDDNWEYNKNAFAEIACRKLAKLGIVRENGDKWELVDPQESEE